MLLVSMDKQTNQLEPGSTEAAKPSPNTEDPLLTVSQAYEHLMAEGLPRSKKTIRTWGRLNHVGEPGSDRPQGTAPVVKAILTETEEQPSASSAGIPATKDHDGDNPSPGNGSHPV